MKDDIFESISQRGSGEETAENRRIHEVADELRRCCQLYEAQLRDGQGDVSRLDVEQRVSEQYVKENGIWIPISDVFELGVPGPSGNENDTYVSNDIIYKVNNLLNSGSIRCLLNRVMWHNNLFTIQPILYTVLQVSTVVLLCLFCNNDWLKMLCRLPQSRLKHTWQPLDL